MQYSNWQAVFFDFLVGAGLILVIFRLIQYALPVLLANRKKYQRILHAVPVIETAVWVFFLSWFTFRFSEIRAVYTLVVVGILIILIFWISRFFLKDLIAGMFFRTSGRFKEGEVISHENQKGFIKKFGIQALEIESQEGQIIFLPYSKLFESYTIKSESKEQSAAFSFVLVIPRSHSHDEIIHLIRAFLISLPWSSVQKAPTVYIREQTENQYTVEVTAFPVEKIYGKKIESMTRAKFLETKPN